MLASVLRRLSFTPVARLKSPAFSTSAPLRQSLDMETVNTTERLRRLRELMKQHKVDVYIVPSEDAHSSEYIAATDARRAFISGFSGSAGTVVVSLDKAVLATDGRYFNQAAKQLDSNWELLKHGLQDVPTWQEWTTEQAEGGKTVGVDPVTITAPEARKLAEKIKKKGGKGLTALAENLVDQVWGQDKPARPSENVRVHPLKFAGKKFQEKIEDLRKELDKKKAAGFVVSMLDEIAWLFNLRGNDIPYNPVFFSYAVVTPTTATLYVDETKLTDDVKAHLAGVHVRPYESIFSDITAMVTPAATTNGHTPEAGQQKFLTSDKASWALWESLGGEEKAEEVRSFIRDAKAIKNDVELEGMRQCHIRDGAALTEFFAWLEHELVEKGSKIDEVEAADKLNSIRSKHDRYVGISFDTISSTGPNAAIIHYSPEPGSCSVINPKHIYLCDSGAQYLDGTTDTTRTLHFGEPTPLEREAFTLVLKGYIALELARFPKGTSGFALDTLARQHLWQNGLEYRHGTGHGVGSFLNVHEGPIGIGTRMAYAEVPLSPGNVVSNEPGYYEDGNFGIRIENVIVVKEVKTKYNFGDKPYLGFDHVTLVPISKKLIDVDLLSALEIKWLDDYHQEVLEKTGPYFKQDELSRKWLERECQPIAKV